MNDKPDESANSGGPEQVDSSAAAQAEAGQGNTAQLQAFAEIKAENAELRDKLLRTMAETENFRRRAEREKADVMKYAVSEFARDAVSIGDNLRRAIDAAQKEPLDQNPALKTLLEGVEVTERELIKVFERHGVTRFDPLGEKFDPHVHEAMVKVDVPGAPADAIVQVLQAGYKIGDRVLRPAAVIVAKGGTPVRAQPESAPADAGTAKTAKDGPAQGDTGVRVHIAHDHDPDVVREPTGAPKGAQGPGRTKERPSGEKRSSSVTQPVTENSGPIKKDDLISSFGKRLENGS
ncbi:MAG: nucleotide exchange factor GrpE [Rhodomicrobium sp.]|nr:nucleotide exchange factor GrpE [Rhodomicrobium sp.]